MFIEFKEKLYLGNMFIYLINIWVFIVDVKVMITFLFEVVYIFIKEDSFSRLVIRRVKGNSGCLYKVLRENRKGNN